MRKFSNEITLISGDDISKLRVPKNINKIAKSQIFELLFDLFKIL